MGSTLQNHRPTRNPAVHLLGGGKKVICGKIISYSCQKKKKEQALESELAQKIKTLECTYNIIQKDCAVSIIRQPKLELSKLRTRRTQFQPQRLHLKNFEYNNKSCKFQFPVARQLKPISLYSGTMTTLPCTVIPPSCNSQSVAWQRSSKSCAPGK